MTIDPTRSVAQAAPAHNISTAAAPKAESAPRDSFTPAGDDVPSAPRKWTVMVYSAADNNLTSYMYADLDEAERVGSDENTAIVAQFDPGASEGCKRLYLTKDATPGKLKSPVVQDMGKRVDMANPKTLSEFVQWGMKNYPAENYFLVISDHGNGWQGAVQDESAGTWMKLPVIAEGLADAQRATGKKLDVLGFDACLMASTEVAHELKDAATYLVASEETEAGTGWPYTNVLTEKSLSEMQQTLRQRIDLTPRDLAAHVVASAATVPGDLPTMAAYDLSASPALTQSVDGLGRAILDSQMSMRSLRKLAKATQGFYDYKDLYDFADRITKSDTVPDKAIKTAAENVKKSIGGMIFAEQHSSRYPNAHGVTIELGKRGGYADIAFAKDTCWDEAMKKMNSWFGVQA